MKKSLPVSLDEFTEENFLSKKPAPSSFNRHFITTNGNTLKSTVKVNPGKKIEYDFKYEGDYSYEEAASTNGSIFKEEIEKAIPACNCNFKESHKIGEEEEDMPSEESRLDLSCKCSSGLESTYTKRTFLLANKELGYLFSTMNERAFNFERTAF